MKRTDAHIHFWDPTRLQYDWLVHAPPLNRRFGPSDAEPLTTASIFVQADCVPAAATDEVDWVSGFADEAGIIGIVAYAPLETGFAVTPFLDQLKTRPLVRGIRRNLQDEAPGFITSPEHIDGLVATARAGLTNDFCVRVHQLPEMIEALGQLFAREPAARIMLDHLGKPNVTSVGDIAADDWARNIETLAAFPNLYAKLSGLMTEVRSAEWDDECFRPYLSHALDQFGASRCMYGSDWPVITLAGSTGRWQAIVDKATASLPLADQAAIWSGTAAKAYRLETKQ